MGQTAGDVLHFKANIKQSSKLDEWLKKEAGGGGGESTKTNQFLKKKIHLVKHQQPQLWRGRRSLTMRSAQPEK